MLYTDVSYDKVKDLSPVDPYGFIDLADAYDKGTVPSSIADNVLNYNQIEDPESIYGTPRDVFESYRMRDRIRAIDKTVNSSDSVTTDKGGE